MCNLKLQLQKYSKNIKISLLPFFSYAFFGVRLELLDLWIYVEKNLIIKIENRKKNCIFAAHYVDKRNHSKIYK